MNARGEDPLVGRAVGEFVLRERIGEGGFGAVYRAIQPALDREAVIKVLHPRLHAAKIATERFLREAKLASKLDHPYAAHIYAFGAEPDGELWIAMELVRGTPLDHVLRIQGPIPLERFVPLLERICEVVHTAHEQGIVHRDLKPANVMVLARAGSLLPKLLDFGIAKALAHEGDLASAETVGANPTLAAPAEGFASTISIEDSEGNAALTQRGAVMGSPPYMAPEQWLDAGAVDARTDLYALGILAFEALTGSPPFSAATIIGYAAAHATASPPPLGSRFPAALDKVIAKVLAKDAADRYGDALTFARAFRQAAGLGSEASLPALAPALRDAAVMTAPQPIAEAVAALAASRNAHQAHNAMQRLGRTIVRYLGLLALACRSRVRSDVDAVGSAELVRQLYRQSLSDADWIALTRLLTRSWITRRDAYPVPELVDAFHDPHANIVEDLQALVAMRQVDATTEDLLLAALTAGNQRIERLLAAIAFTSDYSLVVTIASGIAERWMGVGRAQRTTTVVRGRDVPAGAPVLLDKACVPVLNLTPLIQVAAPSPGAPVELFLFEGRDRHGAKLVTLPSGFELHDDTQSDWFRAQLTASIDDSETAITDERAPYRGLSPFSLDDGAMFFGREKLVDAFVNRLRVQTLLAVVGRSGAGKSSFVQAGAIAALPAGWRAVTMRPGASPLGALSARLQHAGFPPITRQTLSQDSDALGALLRDDAGKRGPIVLVVDQLEELFTLSHDADERRVFAEAVAAAARDVEDPVRVIFTLRDDFLLRTEQVPALRNRIGQGLQLLTVPLADDLLRILVEPAKRVGYEFEDADLPAEMVKEVADQPGALALISFTASKLWELRDRHFKQLTRTAYKTLGGVGGALVRHAELTLDDMPVEQRRLAREAFRHLVTTQNTRAVLERAELRQLLGSTEHADSLIEKLVSARLLVASENERGAETIEIVHEALLVAWPRLVDWRREDAEGARLREQLRSAAKQWDERGRAKGLLWRGDALGDYTRWRARHAGALTDVEAAFADASLRDAARGRRIRRGGVVASIVVLAAVVLILARLTTIAGRERGRAETNQHRAEDLQATAERQVIAQHEEQGRQALLAGDSLRAAAFLSAAYSEGTDHPALRYMLSRAMAPLSAEVARFVGHDGPIHAIDVSPDGRTLVTASGDHTARLWDVETGRLLHTFQGASAALWRARFDTAGGRVVTASGDGAARVYRVADGAIVNTLEGRAPVLDAVFDRAGDRILLATYDGARIWHFRSDQPATVLNTGLWVLHAAWSPDERLLFSCGQSGKIEIWDGAGTRKLHEMDGGPETLICAISPDGKLLASGSADKDVKVWDVEHGTLMRTLSGHSDTVERIAFSPDGQIIATASHDATARLWRVADGRLLQTLVGHSASVTAIAFDRTGRRIVTASRDGTARSWNAATGTLLGVFEGHAEPISALTFATPDRVMTGGFDRTVRVWDLSASRIKTLLVDDAGLESAAFSADNTRIVTAGGYTKVRVWNAPDGALLATIPGVNAALDSHGDRVVVGALDGTVGIWSSRGVAVATLPRHPGAVESVAFSPDDRRVVSIGPDGGRLSTVDGTPIASLAHPNATAVAFSPAGDRVLTGSTDGSVRVWDTRDGRLQLRLDGHGDRVLHVEVSPDGTRAATASQDGTARLWNLETSTSITLRGHAGFVRSIRFDRAGARVVTASDDLTAKIWDVATGRLLGTLSRHDHIVWDAAFDPTGAFVATASLDRTLAIWDARSYRMLDRLSGHNGWIFALAWSSRGDRLLSASVDRTAAIWEFRLESRTPSELAALVRCKVPYALEGGSLQRVTPRCEGTPGAAP